MGDNASESQKLEQKQSQLRQSLDMSGKTVRNLEQQLSQAKSAYGQNSTEVAKLETKLNQAREAENRLKGELNQTNTALREQGSTAEAASSKLHKVGQATKDIGAGLTSTVTPALGAAGVASMKFATDFDGSQRQIQASLGLTAKGAENMGEVVKNVYRKGWGESLEQVNQAVVKVYQNMEDVPGEEIQGVTEDVLALAKTFDIDLGETTRGASQLMKQYGMTGKEAMDFIATGMQGGLDVSNEFLDNLAEYTPLFKQAGFTSDQMLTILKNGTRDGAYNLDYVNDLVKEYGIRIQDGSKSTTDAMGKMSKGTQEMWKEFEAGKRPASDVFYSIIKDLKGMDNQVEATQLGVALFGTKFEDLGNQVVYSMGDTNKALGDTNGRMDELRKLKKKRSAKDSKRH